MSMDMQWLAEAGAWLGAAAGACRFFFARPLAAPVYVWLCAAAAVFGAGFITNRRKTFLFFFYDFADVSWGVRIILRGERRDLFVQKLPFCRQCKSPLVVSEVDLEKCCKVGCSYCGTFLLKYSLPANHTMAKQLVQRDYAFLLKKQKRTLREVRLGGADNFHYE
ncbi:MAG: hypothetical protein NC924_08650 [Candidatus Omnitrophica bacterium]|nr:hypothetical protein [Candidatus Omnitrophota bacterium]